MIKFYETQIQISPCIVSKAKFFLKLKNKKPNNKKYCSISYWDRTIETLSILYKIDDLTKKFAHDNFSNAVKK